MLCLRPLGAKSTSLGFLLAFVEEYQRQRADWAEVGDKARSWRQKRYAQSKLVCSVVTPPPKKLLSRPEDYDIKSDTIALTPPVTFQTFKLAV